MHKILKLLSKTVAYLISRYDKQGNKILTTLFSEYQKYSSNYCDFKLYPKTSSGYLKSSIQTSTKEGEFAIVLQGLIETRDNFTYETVKFYQKMFPKAIIIISTWNYTDPKLIKQFEDLGCEIVLSKDFKPCGYGNVNYQICTSLAGAKRAKYLGAKYVLKNRSDLRIYRDSALEYLKGLLVAFPVDKNNRYNLKGRIISLAGNWGQMFMPYWLQDFIYFGYTDDIINLFNIPYESRNIHSSLKQLKAKYSVVTGECLAKEVCAEMYITKSFLNKYEDDDFSIKYMWDKVKDIFIIVDQEALGTLWNKYGLQNLSNYYCEYDGKHNYPDAMRHLTFEDFLNIYNGYYIYEPWMENKRKEYII
jgi:hypothetical protein